MTEKEFWQKLGYFLERMDFPCKDCVVKDRLNCSKSCAEALKVTYDTIVRR